MENGNERVIDPVKGPIVGPNGEAIEKYRDQVLCVLAVTVADMLASRKGGLRQRADELRSAGYWLAEQWADGEMENEP